MSKSGDLWKTRAASRVPGEREEMTDVGGNAKLCNGNQICRGSFERYMCLPEIFQVHQVIFIWVEDSKASARHTHTQVHMHTLGCKVEQSDEWPTVSSLSCHCLQLFHQSLTSGSPSCACLTRLLAHAQTHIHLSCSHLSLLPAWSGCLSLQSFPNLDGHTYTHTLTHHPPPLHLYSPTVPPPFFPLSSLLYTGISYIWLNTLYISHMDLWTEDKNMSKTFDVDSVSWWKSFIITIPLLQFAPLITPPPRLQSVCFQ